MAFHLSSTPPSQSQHIHSFPPNPQHHLFSSSPFPFSFLSSPPPKPLHPPKTSLQTSLDSQSPETQSPGSQKPKPPFKNAVWINPNSPRAAHLRHHTSDVRYARLVALAASLDSSDPTEAAVAAALSALRMHDLQSPRFQPCTDLYPAYLAHSNSETGSQWRAGPLRRSLLLAALGLLSIPFVSLSALAFLVRPRPVRIPVKGRYVFIIGGSSGIGLALVRRAAAEGARVSILARSAARLQEARDAIRVTTGVVVAVFSADVRDVVVVGGGCGAYWFAGLQPRRVHSAGTRARGSRGGPVHGGRQPHRDFSPH